MNYTTTIKAGYRLLNSIYLGTEAIEQSGLLRGSKVSVAIKEKPEFAVTGTLNSSGILSGMAKVYRWLDLQEGDVLNFEVLSQDQIPIIVVSKAGTGAQGEKPPQVTPVVASGEKVFRRQHLRPIHIELFAPENLNRWEPENEPDVYMAFGVLQEYTKFRYCCATSQSLLDRLGSTISPKPDAILVDDETDEYLVAEFKMVSSDFVKNHKREDIDVLIVWVDNATDKSQLPPTVLCLREIARAAAQEQIMG